MDTYNDGGYVWVRCIDNSSVNWNISDDESWDGVKEYDGDKEVMCPGEVTGFGKCLTTYVVGDPPEWCPYKFEHAIAAGLSVC